jgi:hypothetical protein
MGWRSKGIANRLPALARVHGVPLVWSPVHIEQEVGLRYIHWTVNHVADVFVWSLLSYAVVTIIYQTIQSCKSVEDELSSDG